MKLNQNYLNDEGDDDLTTQFQNQNQTNLKLNILNKN